MTVITDMALVIAGVLIGGYGMLLLKNETLDKIRKLLSKKEKA